MTAKRAVIGLYLFAALVTLGAFSRFRFEVPERMDFRSIYRGAALGVDAYQPNMDGIENLYFLYPPHTLLVSWLLERLPYMVAFASFQIFSLVLLARAMRPYGPAWLALLGPAVFINLAFGQLGIFMSALWLFAFSGSAFAGALLTIKPNFGMLYLFEAIRQRQAPKVAAFVLAAMLLATVVWGLALWPAWFEANRDFTAAVDAHRFNFAFLNVGPLYPFGPLGWIATALVAGACLHRRFDLLTATLAAPVVAPYLLVYDLPAVCAVTGATLHGSWHQLSALQRATLALAFMSPAYSAVAPWLAPLIMLVALASNSSKPLESLEFGREHPNPGASRPASSVNSAENA